MHQLRARWNDYKANFHASLFTSIPSPSSILFYQTTQTQKHKHYTHSVQMQL
jgi:hypothetical protein